MKRWIHRFKEGDLSWEDDHRSGSRLSELSEGIRGQIDKYPLASVKQLAKHFRTFVPTISRMLTAHLGLRKSSRRGPHQQLTDDQKQLSRNISERLLNALRNDESAEFSQVTIAVESWFHAIINPLTAV
jgi:primosomal protein N''